MWDANFAAGVQFPACAHITDADLDRVGKFKPHPKRWPPLRLATRYRGGLHL